MRPTELQFLARSIVATIRQPLLILDAEMRVLEANEPFYAVFRVAEARTVGKVIYALGDGGWDIPELRTLLQDLVPKLGFFEGYEVCHEFPAIGRKVMRLNARLVHADGSGPPLVLLAMEDVTEQTDALTELQRLNRELEDRIGERTVHLQAVNRELEAFCYSVSHDLRAPLRAIDGFSDQLMRVYASQLDDKGQHYLTRIRRGTQRMGQLIDELLQLSRLNRGDLRRERVDLSAMAEEAASELRVSEPSRRVAFSIEPGLHAVGDGPLLHLVMDNLLGNAWKFTSKHPAATIQFGRCQRGGQSAFFVRDDGAGFDMAHVDKLFGAFQRLHPEREFPGNGIGLATVQRIINRHGGQIWAEGQPEKGATFCFNLGVEASQ